MERQTGHDLTVAGFHLDRAGLVAEADPTFDQWEQVGLFLRHAEGAVMWWIGDWLNYGECRWGEKYSQALEATGFAYQTLADAKWVGRRIQFSRRHEKLSWSHHREVARIDDDAEQDSLLAQAEAGGWTRSQLREAVRAIKQPPSVLADEPAVVVPCTEADLASLGAAGKTFGTLYADPPWAYGNQATRAATDNHYETMTVDQILALPVGPLAAPQSHLHLWTTNAFLFECPRILEAWGFEYKGVFVWVKPQIGLGNYWRVAHEFLVLGVRGGLTFDNHAARSWLEIDRGTHSAKPEQVRHLIESVSPGPRLELFGRCAAPGWTVWGNEVERDLFYNNGEQQHG
jgi:N6-adenosine-specific RNA methylase IME4